MWVNYVSKYCVYELEERDHITTFLEVEVFMTS